jgi:hypothetical protein
VTVLRPKKDSEQQVSSCVQGKYTVQCSHFTGAVGRKVGVGCEMAVIGRRIGTGKTSEISVSRGQL